MRKLQSARLHLPAYLRAVMVMSFRRSFGDLLCLRESFEFWEGTVWDPLGLKALVESPGWMIPPFAAENREGEEMLEQVHTVWEGHGDSKFRLRFSMSL